MLAQIIVVNINALNEVERGLTDFEQRLHQLYLSKLAIQGSHGTDTGTPTLTGFGPTAEFTIASLIAAPQLLAPNAIFADGAGLDLVKGHLTVTGMLPGDYVSILVDSDPNGLQLHNDFSITYGGIAIGKITSLGDIFTITFSDTTPPAAAVVSYLIDHLTFGENSNTPTLTRTLTLDVVDGSGVHLQPVEPSFSGTAVNSFAGYDTGFRSMPASTPLLDGVSRSAFVVGGVFGTLDAILPANPLEDIQGLTLIDDATRNSVNFGARSAPAFGPLLNDSHNYLVVGNAAGTISLVQENTTNSGFTKLTDSQNPFAGLDVGADSSPTLADLNGDGRLDLVVGNQDGRLLTFVQNANHSFTLLTGSADPFATISVTSDANPAFADLNGDNRPDLVLGGNNPSFGFLGGATSAGHLVFAPFATDPFAAITVPALPAPTFADLNGDDLPDLILGQGDGTLSTYFNTTQFGRQITVTITPDPPVLSTTQTLGTLHAGDQFPLTQTQLLAGWTNPDGRPMSVTAVTLKTNVNVDPGTLTDNLDGTWTYTAPATISALGTASLTLTVDDGLAHAIGTASIDLLVPAPTGPADVTLPARPEDIATIITQDMLLTGWSQANGFLLSVANLTADAGTITYNGDASWTYSPVLHSLAPVHFTYQVSDGPEVVGAAATLALTPLPPVETSPVYFGHLNQGDTRIINQGSIAPAWEDHGRGFTITHLTATAGTVTDNRDGSWTYTASVDSYGIVDFSYTVEDGLTAATGGATIDIVGLNHAPTGTVTITSQDGTLVEADALSDADGIGPITVFWQYYDSDSADWLYLPDTFGSSFTPDASNAGQTLRALATYVDGIGTYERVGSSGVAVIGTAGNDTLIGGSSDDVLLGGAGRDTAVFADTAAHATWARNPGTGAWTVTSTDGTDTLRNIEALQFTDRTVLLPTAPRDLDGNGVSDILWRNDNGALLAWKIAGLAGIGSDFIAQVDPSWSVAGNVDFTGDGSPDVLWRNINGDTVLWTMNGTSPVTGIDFGVIDPSWQIVATVGANGAGDAEILWRKTSGDTVIWTVNNGVHTTDSWLGNIAPGWSIAGTGDFFGKGNADILWRNTNGDTVIWQMNGPTPVAGALIGTIDPSWKIAGIADFDGKGYADILWRITSGETVIWQMNGAAVVGGGNLGVIDPSWSIAATGDYDGNGSADILWRNSNGATAIWQMQGSTVIGGGLNGSVPTDWHIVA